MTAETRPSVGRDFAWSAFGLASGAVSALALTMVLTRTQSPAEVAAVASALSLVAIAGPLSSLGGAMAAVPLVARAEASQRSGMARHLLRQAAVLAVMTSVAIVTVSWWLPSERRGITIALVVGLPAVAVAAVADSVSRAHHRFRVATVFNDSPRRVLLIVALVATAHVDIALAVALGIASALYTVTIALLIKGAGLAQPAAGASQRGRQLLRITLPFLPLAVFGQVVPQAGVMLVDLVSTDPEVGRMAVAVRFYAITAMLYSVTVRVVAPRVASAKDLRQLAPWLRRTSARATTVVAACAVAIAAGGPALAGALFGSDYRSAWLPAALAAATVVAQAATGFGGVVLNQRGLHRTSSLVALGTSTAFVGGGLLGAHWSGATGVALAGLAATAANGVVTTVIAQRAFAVRLWPSWRRPTEPPLPRTNDDDKGQEEGIEPIEGIGPEAGAQQ